MLEPSRIVHDQAIVFVKEIGSDWTKPLAAQFSFGWLHLFDQLIFGSSGARSEGQGSARTVDDHDGVRRGDNGN